MSLYWPDAFVIRLVPPRPGFARALRHRHHTTDLPRLREDVASLLLVLVVKTEEGGGGVGLPVLRHAITRFSR